MIPELHLRRGSARIDAWSEGTNVVRMQGVMREENVGAWLLPMVSEIHKAALREGFGEVVLDIRVLEYANAALWRCLVHWVKLVCQEQRKVYKLRVLCDCTRSWQQIGVPSLRPFSLDASGDERLILESEPPLADLS